MTDQEQVLRDLFSEILQKLFSAGIGIEITNNKVELQIPVKVRNGGTGVDNLTGYVKGNGDAPLVGVNNIPAEDISGVLPVSNGGTGLHEVQGYLFGSGSSISGVNSVPVEDVFGLGDIAKQSSNNVAITGGSIKAQVIQGDIAGNASSINTVLPLEKGGTGVKTKEDLQKSLGYAMSGINKDITSLSGLTTPLSVQQGGTGSMFVNGFVRGVNGSYVGTETISGHDIEGDISGNAANVNEIVPVAKGGTGVKSLTGYVVGNGEKEFNSVLQIPGKDIVGDIAGMSSNITGIVSVANGGTGQKNLDGYLFGNGASVSGKKAIPFEDVEGVGSLAKQDSDNVNIYGGSATLSSLSTTSLQFTGPTHQSYTMTSNMPLMHPVGFLELKVGNKICKVPYYEY